MSTQMNWSIPRMLATHPHPARLQPEVLAACVEACADCAYACTACADACLGEAMVQPLVRCIRLNLDCADICDATGRLLARQTQPDWSLLRRQVEACQAACQVCGAECAQHAAMHEHCAVCADACQRCEQACANLLAAFPA
ncbi:MAG TPA: four-helix bundle copper-binding protein [Caldilineaceae bacterium]|nr:four-helix bundle copper-binding protein [Caldilineaceae bacterium]